MNHYITVGEYSLEEVFKSIPNDNKRKVKAQFGTHSVKVSSDRLITFKRNHTCVCCGLEGNLFCLQMTQADVRDGNSPHFNLYNVSGENKVMLTKDHILAIANGGKDVLENYQTMCEHCNSIKAHGDISLDKLRNARRMFDSGIERNVIEKFVLDKSIESF